MTNFDYDIGIVGGGAAGLTVAAGASQQYRIENGADGSRTVWVGELELRHRMRWAVGYTLRPGVSYLEVAVRILNRTPLVQSMLAFANVAVNANDDYQIIFPPSTE